MSAIGDDRVDVSFRLTAADYRAMMQAYWRRTKARRFWVWLLIAATIITGMMAAAVWWRTRDPVLLALAVFLLSSPITAPMINRRAYDHMFERQRLGAGDTRIVTDDHHLSAVGPTGEFKFAWSDFRKIDVTSEHVLLWVHDYLCVIVPIRAFDVAQARKFVDLVRRRTTPAIR